MQVFRESCPLSILQPHVHDDSLGSPRDDRRGNLMLATTHLNGARIVQIGQELKDQQDRAGAHDNGLLVVMMMVVVMVEPKRDGDI